MLDLVKRTFLYRKGSGTNTRCLCCPLNPSCVESPNRPASYHTGLCALVRALSLRACALRQQLILPVNLSHQAQHIVMLNQAPISSILNLSLHFEPDPPLPARRLPP